MVLIDLPEAEVQGANIGHALRAMLFLASAGAYARRRGLALHIRRLPLGGGAWHRGLYAAIESSSGVRTNDGWTKAAAKAAATARPSEVGADKRALTVCGQRWQPWAIAGGGRSAVQGGAALAAAARKACGVAPHPPRRRVLFFELVIMSATDQVAKRMEQKQPRHSERDHTYDGQRHDRSSHSPDAHLEVILLCRVPLLVLAFGNKFDHAARHRYDWCQSE